LNVNYEKDGERYSMIADNGPFDISLKTLTAIAMSPLSAKPHWWGLASREGQDCSLLSQFNVRLRRTLD
jgi:hypothetical protein